MYSKNIIRNRNNTNLTSNDIFTKMKSYMLTLDYMNNSFSSAKENNSFTVLVPKAKPPPIETRPSVEAKQPIVQAKQHTVQAKQPIVQAKQILTTPVKEKKVVSPFFFPRQKDSLFWCFFIIKNGFSAYEYPGTTSFVKEKELKFEYIESLRKSKQTLKVKKIKNLQEDVEHELANKEKIGMKTFIALCIAMNINVLFIHKKKCFELVLVEDEPIYVIHQKEENGHTKYCYEQDVTKEAIEHYRKTYFLWDNVDKPLKAASAYKLEDLQNLCKTVGIIFQKCEKRKTKKELYDLLITTI